jgi:putative transposase
MDAIHNQVNPYPHDSGGIKRWYLAYSLSYRGIEELALERGLKVDHSTVNRWVMDYSTQLEESFRQRYKRPVGMSWRMDETYIKVKGK